MTKIKIADLLEKAMIALEENKEPVCDRDSILADLEQIIEQLRME